MHDELAGELLNTRRRDLFVFGLGAGVLATAGLLFFHGQSRLEDNSPVEMAVNISKCHREHMPKNEVYCEQAAAIQINRDLAAGEELSAGLMGIIGLMTALPRVDRLKQIVAVERYIQLEVPSSYDAFNNAWFAFQDKPQDRQQEN